MSNHPQPHQTYGHPLKKLKAHATVELQSQFEQRWALVSNLTNKTHLLVRHVTQQNKHTEQLLKAQTLAYQTVPS